MSMNEKHLNKAILFLILQARSKIEEIKKSFEGSNPNKVYPYKNVKQCRERS